MGGLRLAGALLALVAIGALLTLVTANPPPRPFRSAPLGALDKPLTRIALGSCADQREPEPLWSVIGQSKPDLFIFAGNAVFGDAPSAGPGLSALAVAYNRFSHLSAFRSLRRRVPIMAIWDDRDYGQEAGDSTFAEKEQAKALFMKFWGIKPDSPRAQRPGLYDARIIGPPGQRVQIILLDLRWFRDPWKILQEAGKPLYGPDPDPSRTMLGTAQWDWLAGELKKEAELRLIVSPIQIEAEGAGTERWGDFPAERERLFTLIAHQKANGVVFLSGNRMAGGLYRRTEGSPYPLFEMTASPLNAPLPPKDEREPDRLGPMLSMPNFGLITVDWALRTVRLELRDGAGQALVVASAPMAALRPAAQSTSFVREEGP
jgi:alkaline phosphatase D